MNDAPAWLKIASAILFLLATYTAVMVWASDAHSANAAGIIENRVRVETNQQSLESIESKVDRILFLMAGGAN